MPLTAFLPLWILVSIITIVSAWNINSKFDRELCQSFTKDPLFGCDVQRTFFVDGGLGGNSSWVSGGRGNGWRFASVQDAVKAVPNTTEPYTILVAPGNYTEQINITLPTPLYLLGQTSHPTNQSLNTVQIIWAAIAGTADNAYTSTLTIAPTLNASLTGSGTTGFAVPADTPFGCSDFRTYNLDFLNIFAPYSDGPSLALSISYANGGFYYTGFYSYQDTIYVGKLGNAYMKSGSVAGQTDFFYGFGTAWVEDTNIELRSCGGGITAWKGTNTTFTNKYGVYIVDSHVALANSSLDIVGKCALGRPWNAQHRSIFSNTKLPSAILPTGYIDWSPSRYTPNLTLQAEYQNYGPGWNVTARETGHFDTLLTAAQWAVYDSPKKVFMDGNGKGSWGWVDWGV